MKNGNTRKKYIKNGDFSQQFPRKKRIFKNNGKKRRLKRNVSAEG